MAQLKQATCNHCHQPILTGWIDGLTARANPTLHTTQWAHIWKALQRTTWEANTFNQPTHEWQGNPTRHNLYLQHICWRAPPAIAVEETKPDPIDPPY